MKVLLHYQNQQLKAFNDRIVLVSNNFVRGSTLIQKSLLPLIDDVQTYFQRIGASTQEGKVNKLRLYFNMALSGVDPNELKKIKIGRRENIKIAAYYCLSNLTNIIEESSNENDLILEEATEMINQVVLSALQSKVIDYPDIENINNIEASEAIWSQLIIHEQLKLIDKKLRLKILQQDIYIILDQLFTRIKS